MQLNTVAAALSIFAILAMPTRAHAHGGGLDSNGCHHDRRAGTYHCHRAASLAFAPATPPGPADTAHQPAATVAPIPAPPTCYTGPRGGRYTITASGRKNYRGC